MKKTITITLASIASMGLMSFGLLSDNGRTNSTGGHGEGSCSNCHGGAGSGSVSVSSTPSLSGGYSAGTSYTIHLTVAQAGKVLFGLDFQALNSSYANAGTLTAGTGTHLATASGIVNITHNLNGGVSANSHTFDFTWMAPATSTGNVTFWYAGLAANGDGNDGSGDNTYTGSLVITPASTSTMTVAIVGTNATCNGASNGSATATPTGGTPPYTYSWAPSGGSAATATGLAAGTYSCTVTGSPGGPTTQTVTITQPAVLTATTSQTNVPCNGSSTGTATVVPTGGTSPYTYSWVPSGGTGAIATGLAAGTYTCTITGSGSANCTLTKSFTITQPSALTATSTTTQTGCTTNIGSATVTPSGGTAGYTYSWNNGQTTQTATGLAVGTYTCTIMDANSCTITKTVIISASGGPSATIASQTNLLCNGATNGAATINVTGGTSPYTYNWSPSGGTNATATGLGSGIYTCAITDAGGCTTIQTVTITQPTSLAATATSTQTGCTTSTGTATVTPSGGTPTYTYSWNDGQTTQTATGLAVGTYTCTIADANSCTITKTVTISASGGPSATIASQTNPLCNGATNGDVTINVTGGTSPYTFNWLPFGGTNATANGLGSGTYTCTIIDAVGCATIQTVTLTQPVALTATATSTEAGCSTNIGTATVIPSGGTAAYTYSWNDGQTTQTATGLAVGTYTCTITDANGCTTEQTVDVSTSGGPSATISTQTNVLCKADSTGSATIEASGGTAPYTYSWDTTPPQTTATATNLTAGNYTGMVTDNNGCTTTVSVSITEPATAITATLSSTPENGTSNGTATVTASGGTGTLSYLWTPGGQTTATATGLASGTYSVTVTDTNNCSFTDTISVGTTVGITSINPIDFVQVYPNPSKGALSVEINASANRSYSLKVMNSIGQIIHEEVVELQAGKNIFPVILDEQFEGLFFVQIQSDEGIQNIPIMKVK